MKLSPSRFPISGLLVTIVGFALLLAATVGAWVAIGFAQFGGQSWAAFSVVGICLAVAGIGLLGLRIGARLRAQTASGVLAKDARDPVLYCRAFSADGSGNEEEAIAHLFRGIGPVIAVGRPGDRLLVPGAARMYLSDEEWQQTVAGLLADARLVLIKVSATPNLLWEFQTAVERLPGNRIVLIPPKERKEWEQFREMADWVDLPRDTGGAMLICWDRTGHVRKLWRISQQGEWWQDPRILDRLLFLTNLQ